MWLGSKESVMNEIPLNDLPRFTPWVCRLLSLDPFPPARRDIKKVDEEYDKDKYGKCLAYFRGTRGASAGDVKRFEIGDLSEKELCVSQGGRLYTASPVEALRRHHELLLETLDDGVAASDTVVELGCGYGYNLHLLKRRHPGKRFLGGEYSANGVRLAQALFSDDPGITVERFNYYDEHYPILRHLPGRVLLFTSHSIEQLPSAAGVIRSITRSGITATVCHLEPVFELTDETTVLGLLRRRYIQMNDYNRDLLTSLEQEGVKVDRKVVDAFGLNPLNPTSILRWHCG
jgi:hypothetical protein